MQLLLTGELECLTLLVCSVRTMMTVLCINCWEYAIWNTKIKNEKWSTQGLAAFLHVCRNLQLIKVKINKVSREILRGAMPKGKRCELLHCIAAVERGGCTHSPHVPQTAFMYKSRAVSPARTDSLISKACLITNRSRGHTFILGLLIKNHQNDQIVLQAQP